MKTLLMRFESEMIHILETTIESGEIILGNKEKISLGKYKKSGEKYQQILNMFTDLQETYSPDIFYYHTPGKFRGIRKDEQGVILSGLLELFGYQNKLEVLDITKQYVKGKLDIKDKEFKALKEEKKGEIVKQYGIAKTDKILDCLIYVYMIKHIL